MEDKVYPLEREVYENKSISIPKIKALQEEAKRDGIWALGHPKEV